MSVSPPMKCLVISDGTELLRVPVDRLMYVSSEGNYSSIVTLDGRKHVVSLQLGQVEDMIGEIFGDVGGSLLRIGRGLIINVDYLYFIDLTKQELVVSDCAGSCHKLHASREALAKLKAYVEDLTKKENGNGRIEG